MTGEHLFSKENVENILIKKDGSSTIFLKELPEALVRAGYHIDVQELKVLMMRIYSDALDETGQIKDGITALSDTTECKRRLYEKISQN